jgi:FtsH-binding integral membrane protein
MSAQNINDKSASKLQINSVEKSSHWILVVMGIIFLLVSLPILFSIAEEVRRGNNGIFVALIFPLAGLAMLFSGYKMRQKFLFFGPTPLVPSPAIGQVGGQIGGHIELDKPWAKRKLTVTLSCIHTYTSGSGKNSTTHRDILWQEHDKPLDRPNGAGSKIEFCFDVPAGERPADSHKGRGKVHWEISLEGLVDFMEFKRSWKVPAEAGTQQSSIAIPTAHKEASLIAKRKEADASIEQQIQTEKTASGLDIISEQGRNKSMSYFMVLFGLVFTLVGCFLFYQALSGEAMLWIMAPIFFSIGFGILCYGIFLVGRKLECKIIDDQVYTRRSLFGRIIYTRQGKLTSAKQLRLKTTMSSQSNNQKTEYMAIYAKVSIEGLDKEIKLVEGIEGKLAGEAMQRKLTDFLQQGLTDELGAS